MRKLTTEQFIKKAKSIHGNRYDYSKVLYVNARVLINIVCEEHGEFDIRPDAHLSGQKCKKCAFIDMKRTNLVKYGVERPAQNKEVYAKAKKTNLERYGAEIPLGNEEIQEKSKQTNLKRYGVDNPFQSKEIQEKIKKTNLERYGVENPQQNKIVQEKTKRTNLERYGVEYLTQSEDIYNKIKATNLSRYGFEVCSKNYFVKEAQEQTNIKKYGFKHKNQSHMVDILHLIKNKEWLFEQYIILNKTALQISEELNISDVSVGNYLYKYEIEIRYTVGYSMKCIQWLELIMKLEGIFIQHAMNGGEYRIPGTRYKVDGYCKETNTVYEFHGDCFHGNPDLFKDHETPNFYNRDITAKELYDNTINRENKIKELGFNLVVMWENDFNKR